ncbi:MAG: C40 family peptidase [Bacteroidia bacterium]|nr:C40 family peptidase [Bacteroidia bacterium]MCX7653035.1 C40 family peptidase [Bacteroidia bacterium]MDW8416173.1 C40 family peptidase [Bacteroidia bacterium]
MSSAEWLWMPRLPYVPLRAEPNHRSEQVSELLWGEPQQILDEYKGWVLVRGRMDGYVGWVEAGTLHYAFYDGSGWGIVRVRQTKLIYEGRTQGWVSFGALFPQSGCWHTAMGRYWISSAALIPWKSRPLSLRLFYRVFAGTPYRWGGKTPFGIDCSGLTQLAYRWCGRLIPRDAYQQAEAALPVETPQKGDFVFFTAHGSQRISHVGLYIGRDKILHATPAQGVHIGTLRELYTHTFHSFRTLLTQDFVI